MPNIKVIGIDLTQAMLDILKQKHPDKNLHLICGNYFEVPFDIEKYDCAISFQTIHHFSKDSKLDLYKKIYQALVPPGIYIECDYMVESQEDEDFYFAEYARIRNELNLKDSEFYHYDTPCTINNQIKLLKDAGFKMVEQVFRIENTTMLVAHK